MAILQVRDIDNNLYESLRARAKREKRSVSQEVIKIIEEYLAQPNTTTSNPTEEFLKLEWKSDNDENAEDMVNEIRKNRNKKSARFGNMKNVFD
jgi:plasmid stability protein